MNIDEVTMLVMPPPQGVQALMLGLAVLLGAAIGRVLFAPRCPNETLGLIAGFGLVSWFFTFVGGLVLGTSTEIGNGPRHYHDWRAMEYMGWIQLLTCLLGLTLLAVIYKMGPRFEKSAFGFKTILLLGVSLLICLVLINNAGFVATLLWTGEGWTALLMTGFLIIALTALAVCLGVIRNQISGDGPSWLRGSR